MILAFVDEETEEGEAMLDLLIELVNDNEQHAGTLKIILIDPDEHPLMLDVWEDMFGIDIEHGPQIGLVDLSEVCVSFGSDQSNLPPTRLLQEDSLWFDMAQLNLEEADENEDDNEEVLQAWIDQILDGTIDLDDGMFYLYPHIVYLSTKPLHRFSQLTTRPLNGQCTDRLKLPTDRVDKKWLNI
jgi:hypothetical protein